MLKTSLVVQCLGPEQQHTAKPRRLSRHKTRGGMEKNKVYTYVANLKLCPSVPFHVFLFGDVPVCQVPHRMFWLQPSLYEAQWVEDIQFNLLVSRFVAGSKLGVFK